MSKVLGVRFREIGKISYFIYPDNEMINVEDFVIAETKKGIEFGKVVFVSSDNAFEKTLQMGEKIIRKATKDDIKSVEQKKIQEKQAGEIFHKKIKEHNLKMKLLDVEYTFNRTKVIFYFVSESRVDFRNLVKDLARVFRIRIELRQIGIRDEAKMLGGLGYCGRPLCCSTFLNDFQHVSVKMAKDQGMSLNPIKLAGACGRLMCCLKYEQDGYREIINGMPQIGETVLTPEGQGIVIGHDTMKGEVKVSFDSEDEMIPFKSFKFKDITSMK